MAGSRDAARAPRREGGAMQTTTTHTPTTAEPARNGAPASPEPLIHMLQGLQASGILRAGIQLGVFDQIAAGHGDPASVAAAIGADERGTRILLDALAALGVLTAGDGYGLTASAETFLISTRPTYIGGAADIFTGDWAWEHYGRLAQVFRQGGTLMDQDAEAPGHEFWVTFADASAGVMAPAAHGLAELLEPWAGEREELDVLDVACGAGLYGLALARTHPAAQVTLLDWDNVLARAGENVARMGLEDRTRFLEGDAFEVELGGPYDVVIASHFLHHFSPERCVKALQRFAAALKPGGRIVINEFTTTAADPADDPFPALFSVNMMVWSHEGEAYSVDTYARWLAETGFAAPEVHDARGLPSRLLIAERQA
jgi:ubiquinone/menaquinone biosynthesis C-methylase UbiE